MSYIEFTSKCSLGFLIKVFTYPGGATQGVTPYPQKSLTYMAFQRQILQPDSLATKRKDLEH